MERMTYRMVFSSPHPKMHTEVLMSKRYRIQWSVSCSSCFNSQGRMPHKTDSQSLLTELSHLSGNDCGHNKVNSEVHTPIIKSLDSGFKLDSAVFLIIVPSSMAALYSGDPRFEFSSKNLLAWLNISVVFLSHSRQLLGQWFKFTNHSHHLTHIYIAERTLLNQTSTVHNWNHYRSSHSTSSAI
jgi:hypothetical protein